MAHEELKKQYAIDAEYSDTPWEKWEFKNILKWETLDHPPHWRDDTLYRRKPPEKDIVITIKAGDRWTSEPPDGSDRWMVDLDGNTGRVYDSDYWQGGQLFKTEQAARAFADALKIK